MSAEQIWSRIILTFLAGYVLGGTSALPWSTWWSILGFGIVAVGVVGFLWRRDPRGVTEVHDG